MVLFICFTAPGAGLHRPADAGPGCPKASAAGGGCSEPEGWAAAQSGGRVPQCTNRRDTPQPGESLEVHQKKASTKRCSLFCCPSPCGAASPFAPMRSGSARRDSRPEKSAFNKFILTATSKSTPNHDNPSLFPTGDEFGLFFLFLKEQSSPCTTAESLKKQILSIGMYKWLRSLLRFPLSSFTMIPDEMRF